MKDNSGKKASPSSVFGKSPTRALGVKNTQSPQRSQDGPIKPTIGKGKSSGPITEMSQADASPTKKKNSKSRSPSKSPTKSVKHLSPTREDAIPFALAPPLPSPQGLDEGTSYHTTSTPHPTLPTTPTSAMQEERCLQRQSSFVTPAANIGQAGAMRLRKGEMLDAMNMAEEEVKNEIHQGDIEQETLEDEMYSEVEYMPPKVGKSWSWWTKEKEGELLTMTHHRGTV